MLLIKVKPRRVSLLNSYKKFLLSIGKISPALTQKPRPEDFLILQYISLILFLKRHKLSNLKEFPQYLG